MTDAQYAALPHLARTIVDFDRSVRGERGERVVDIRFYRELLEDRRSLGRAADRLWGVPAAGGDVRR